MATRYDYVVLDIDGTLYSHRKYLKACEFAVKRLLEYAAREHISKPFIASLTKYLKRGKVTYAVNRICKRYKLRAMPFFNRVYDIDPAKFGVTKSERLISEFKRVNKVSEIALFTNSPDIWASRVISELGVSRLVKKRNIVTLDRLDNAKVFKPSKEAFAMLMRILHTGPDRIVFLDDDTGNIEEARRLGIKAIQICNDGKCHLDGHDTSRTIYEELNALASDSNK